MRILVVAMCSLALVSAYGAQKDKDKSQQKKQAHTAQRAAQPTSHPTGARTTGQKTPMTGNQGQNARKSQTSAGAYAAQKGKKNQTSMPAYDQRNRNRGGTSTAARENQKAKTNQNQIQRQAGTAAKGRQIKSEGKPGASTTAATRGNTAVKGKAAQGQPVKPQHFNVPKQPNTAKAPAVKFQQGRHIQGSQNWQGARYTVFRNYTPQWHNQGWWRSHHNRIVFVFGAPYYWNAGYWFPAWGYYPNAYYAWDGPVYAYNNLPPDQVIANVQATLQQQGYYHGEVDGLIGPLTRGAIADYQRDHGLYTTSTIDQPTLQSLGMA